MFAHDWRRHALAEGQGSDRERREGPDVHGERALHLQRARAYACALADAEAQGSLPFPFPSPLELILRG